MNASDNAENTTTSTTPTPKSKRRRWPRILGGVAGLLVLIVILLPYLLSTGPARTLVLRIVNGQVRGKVALGDLSLRWFGPTRLGGLSVSDPAGRSVLEAKELTWSGGLWKAVFSPLEFGRIEAHSPRVLLYQTPEGFSLQEAISLRKPRPSEGPLPRPRGTVVISDGQCRLVNSQNKSIQTTDIKGEVSLDSLEEIGGNLSLLVSGSTVQVEWAGHRLFKNDQFDLKQAQITASVKTQPPLDLAGLADYFEQDIHGQAGIDLKAQLQDGRLKAQFSGQARGLQVQEGSLRRGQPTDLNLTANLDAGGDRISGDINLAGPAANLEGDFAYVPASSGQFDLGYDRVLSAILKGSPLPLPQVSLHIRQGTVNLPALAQAAPGLLRLRENVEITGGQVQLQEWQLAGDPQPKVQGKLTVQGLAANISGKPQTYQPIVLDVDASLQGGTGLVVKALTLQADFAQLQASGKASQLKADLKADLALLNRQADQMLNLGDFQIGGAAQASLSLASAQDNQIDFSGELAGQDLSLRAGQRHLTIDRLQVSQQARLDLDQHGLRRLSVRQADIQIDQAQLQASDAWYDFGQQTYGAAFKLQRADLGYIQAKLQGLGLAGGKQFTAVLAGEGKVGKDAPDAAILSSGQFSLENLKTEGKVVTQQPVKLEWQNLRIASQADSYAVDSCKLQSDLASFELAGARLAGGDVPQFDGQWSLKADLGRLAAAAAIVSEGPPQPVSGTVELSGAGKTLQGVVHANGTGSFANLIVQGRQFGAGQINVEDLALSNRAQDLDLKGFVLKSDLASATASLRAHLQKPFALDGQLDLQADLEKATALAALVQGKEPPKLTGGLAWSGTFQTTPQAVTAKGTATLSRLALSGKGVDPKDLVLNLESLEMARDLESLKLTRLTLTGGLTNLQASDVAAGWGKGFSLSGHIEAQADVATTLAVLAAAGVAKSPPALGGRADISVTSAVDDKGSRLDGQGRIQDLTLDGRSLQKDPTTLNFSGASFSPDMSQLSIAQAKLQSGLGQANADSVTAALGGQTSLDGNFSLSADLAKVMDLVGRLRNQPPPQISGQLAWSGNARTAKGTISLSGQGQVDNLQAGSGQERFQEKQVRLAHQVEINPQTEVLTIRQSSIDSQMLTAKATGTVQKYRTDRILDIKGTYAPSYEQLTTLLHELYPSTQEELALAGGDQKEFTLTGAMGTGEGPVFQTLSGGANIGWRSGEVLGIPMGQASISPSLKQGVVTIPLTAVPASGGNIRLTGLIDMRNPVPILTMPDQVSVLEKVRIDKKAGKQLLGRINPIFSDLTQLDGTVTLAVQEMYLPLGAELVRTGRAKGRLDLSDLRLQPAGVLGELLDAVNMGQKGPMLVQVKGVDLDFRDGRISYDNFTLVLAGNLDLVFKGSVGLVDNSVDLTVSVPIRAGLLEKLGVKGPVGDLARMLEKVRIDIPLSGNRLATKLDLAKVDIRPLIQQATKELLKEGAGRTIEDLLRQPSSPSSPKGARPQNPLDLILPHGPSPAPSRSGRN